MSKKVSVLEGQKGSKFSGVQYLRTNLSGGGVCEWIPEDGVKLTTKRITKNGDYLARSEKDSQNNPYYAFSQVTIAVKNSTTGTKDPSTGGDGNEYSVSTDPDTGMLTETILPSKIKIETLPQKLEYLDGETIELTGAVVKAYKKDNTLWTNSTYPNGIIPIEELVLNPSIAHGMGNEGSSTVDGETWNYSIQNEATVYSTTYQSYEKYSALNASDTVYAFGYKYTYAYANTEYEGVWLASSKQFDCHEEIQNHDASKYELEGTISKFKKDEKTVYYYGRNAYDMSWGPTVDVPLNIDPIRTTGRQAEIAWDIVYGDHSSGGDGEVTVTWNRPEDFKALTDTFEIEVTPSN